jgi:hypothetical protein
MDKATGPDGIPARLLKECLNKIALSLTALFKKSLSLGKVPQEWKEALTLFRFLRKVTFMKSAITTDFLAVLSVQTSGTSRSYSCV